MSDQHYEEIRQKYIAANVAGNSAGIAQTFTDDCSIFPPDGPVMIGKAGVQAFYDELFSQMTPSSMSITPEEEVTMGDWGYVVGSWAATATLKTTGATVQLDGKYMSIMKRQADGEWRVHRHTWNAPTQLAAMVAQQG